MVVLAMDAADTEDRDCQPLFVGSLYAAADGAHFGVEWLLASLPHAIETRDVVCSGATVAGLSFSPDGATLAVAFEPGTGSSAVVTYQIRRQPSLTFSVARVLDVRDGPAPDEIKFCPSPNPSPSATADVLSALWGSDLTLFVGTSS